MIFEDRTWSIGSKKHRNRPNIQFCTSNTISDMGSTETHSTMPVTARLATYTYTGSVAYNRFRATMASTYALHRAPAMMSALYPHTNAGYVCRTYDRSCGRVKSVVSFRKPRK